MINYSDQGQELTSDTKNTISTHESKLIMANAAYTQDGNHNYFVNDSFKSNDMILPIPVIGESTATDQAKKMKDLIDKVDNMSISTMHSDVNSRRNSDPEVNTGDYSSIMMKRWESHIQTMPSIDQSDIQKDCPLITQVEVTEDTVNQAVPEFSQVSYLRLRSIEEVFAIKNYLDP